MLDFILQYWEFIWNAYKNLMVVGSSMGIFAIVVWVLGTVFALAVGILAPIVVTIGLIAFVLVAGVKIGVFMCLILLVVAATQAVHKSDDDAALRKIMSNNLAISANAAQDIRKAQKEFDMLLPAHRDLWKDEMWDRKRALEKGSYRGVIETSHATLIGNNWVWKDGRELKDPSKLKRPE